MIEEVYNSARILLGEIDTAQQETLRVLCEIAVSALTAQLKDGVTAEDCGGLFQRAAGLYALAAMESMGTEMQEFKAGDLTIKTGGSKGQGLKLQAEQLLAPYLKERFLFTGV